MLSLGDKASKPTHTKTSLLSCGQCAAKLHRYSDATSFTAGMAHLISPLPFDCRGAQNPLQASNNFLSSCKKQTEKKKEAMSKIFYRFSLSLKAPPKNGVLQEEDAVQFLGQRQPIQQ